MTDGAFPLRATEWYVGVNLFRRFSVNEARSGVGLAVDMEKSRPSDLEQTANWDLLRCPLSGDPIVPWALMTGDIRLGNRRPDNLNLQTLHASTDRSDGPFPSCESQGREIHYVKIRSTAINSAPSLTQQLSGGYQK